MCWSDLSPAETAAIAAIVTGRPGVSLILDECQKRKRRVLRRARRRQTRIADPGATGTRDARKRLRPPRHAVMTWDALIGLGHSEATLDGLITAGWLADWTVPKRPRRITLTCWGAEQYQRILAETESEVPYWERDATPAPGDPAPKPPPLVMPAGYKTRRMPDWVLQLFPDQKPGPVEEAVAREEYVMQAAVTSTGEPVRDPITGLPKLERIKLLGQEIPRAKPRRKKSKKQRK